MIQQSVRFSKLIRTALTRPDLCAHGVFKCNQSMGPSQASLHIKIGNGVPGWNHRRLIKARRTWFIIISSPTYLGSVSYIFEGNASSTLLRQAKETWNNERNLDNRIWSHPPSFVDLLANVPPTLPHTYSEKNSGMWARRHGSWMFS